VQGSPADGQPAPLRGGQLLAAISNRIVGMLHEHYGRGPINAKTSARLVACLGVDGARGPLFLCGREPWALRGAHP